MAGINDGRKCPKCNVLITPANRMFESWLCVDCYWEIIDELKKGICVTWPK